MSGNEGECTKTAFDDLARKGFLNNPDDWKKSVDEGPVYERLPMFITFVLDRVSDTPAY